jgi:hypothetical protein
MSVSIVLVIGAVIGALDGVGIFFAPDEPFKIEIFVSRTILKEILVALLTGLSLTSSSAWWQGALYGLLYGVAFALVIFLTKGGFKSMDAPYVVASGAILGIVTGLLLLKFAFPKLRLRFLKDAHHGAKPDYCLHKLLLKYGRPKN